MRRYGRVFFDIKINPKYSEGLTDSFCVSNSIEVLAFRMVTTAGFALPTFQVIMTSTNEDYLNSFNENNLVVISVGSADVNDVGHYECETIGKHVKKASTADGIYLLNWGGVIKSEKLNSTFLKTFGEGCYTGTATEVLKEAWKDIAGTPIDIEDGQVGNEIRRIYRRQHKTANNFLVDVFLHMDRRPSFPLVTINTDGKLRIRDFATLKKAGPVATFVPAGSPTKMLDYPYLGEPQTVSYKTYTNRVCGYMEISGRNAETGKIEVVGSGGASVEKKGITYNKDTGDLSTPWGLQKLATTSANEQNPVEQKSAPLTTALLNSETPADFHSIAQYNRNNLINMSSIQTTLRVEDKFIERVKVLDIVKLQTKRAEDPTSGLYIVEAMEQGFVKGTGFTNNIYLCRDNFNDVEKYNADPYARMARGWLNIDAKTKADLSHHVASTRKGLAHVKRAMDGSMTREWEAHVVAMREAALSNFFLFGHQIDLNNLDAIANSLQVSTSSIFNKLIRLFIDDPLASLLINLGLGDASILNLIMGLLEALFGSLLFSSFEGLLSDLKYFFDFLTNYRTTVKQVDRVLQPNYVEYFTKGTYTFTESPTGELIADLFRDSSDVRSTDVTVSDEEKSIIIDSIVNDIKDRIPISVDIPIPEISIDDSEAIKPTDEIENDVIDIITGDLTDKGYVYDPNKVNDAINKGLGNEKSVLKPDGSYISPNDAILTMLSADSLSSMLKGNIKFDSLAASKLKNTVGETIYVRHWGTFISENELASFNINRGYVDKYKTINCTKMLTVRGGKRIYVALPAHEENITFYINSEKVNMGTMEYSDLGYLNSMGYPIPYIIYYTPDSYNSSSVSLEIRRGN